MGLIKSRPGNVQNPKKRKKPKHKKDITSSQQVDDYEDYELRVLKRTIARYPERFILNNLMMCIQFFENFEEDMNRIKETLASAYEDKLNKMLPPSKHVLLPDVLQKYIARNIDFTSKRQTGEPVIEPLQPIRMYIVHDNIEVTEQYYLPEYSSLNSGVTYSMMVQPIENQPGYVRLRCLDETPYMKNINPSSTTDSTYDGDDELYDQNTNTKFLQQIKKNDRSGYSKFGAKSSSILQDNETIYEDQAYISRGNLHGSRIICDTSSSTSKAICEEINSSSGYNSDSSNYLYNKTTTDTSRKVCSTNIPSDCFKEVRINSEGKIYSREKLNRKPQNSKQFHLIMADRQYDSNVFFMSSKMFMNYFVRLFIDQLAESLSFKKQKDGLDFVENSVIHCYKMLESHIPKQRRIDSYEITPTIWLQWPEFAQEWLYRPRSTWPNENDVNKIKDFGCYIIPENSLPKQNNSSSSRLQNQTTKKNIYQEIEWQLAFPAAERYLETCMTHSQVQVYLIALMLHKTFLRPVQERIYGLTINHIRNKLFWLIEENDRPSSWPDNRTGDCLIKLLKSLYDCISQTEPILEDYFVHNKNMFQQISNAYLLHSQKQLKRIIENPVMYVFNTLEYINYRDQFFPKLDLEYLLKILTNPGLSIQVPTQRKPIEREKYEKTGGLWSETKKSPQIYWRVNANRTVTTRATDNIVEISERCADLEGPRLAKLLEFFVRHFIKMADYCHRYRAYSQKMVYLDQADRLSIILSEQNDRYIDDAKAYRDKIKALRKREKATNSTVRLQNELPKTPKRNILGPIFAGNLKDRFTPHVAEVHVKPSKDEQSHSSREDYADNKIAKAKNATASSYDKNPYTGNPVSTDQSDDDEYRKNPMSMRSKSDDDLYPRRSISKNQDNENSYKRSPTSMSKSNEDLCTGNSSSYDKDTYTGNPISTDQSDDDEYKRNPMLMRSKSDDDLYPRRSISKNRDNETPYRKNPTSMSKSDKGHSISTDQSDDSASGISITQKVVSLTDNLTETTYI
ncbi:uncharacterized protein LOC109855550 [Pseudomyrmex gracilis]|uniref:uncharacterized protein LOC109855550 n=1 Tax=Pseudomyrmex gracilis TaxID=219809 RepID=UPI000995A410|nr:uncharacterized protein LOC109855550 [Pseudomyrmex gracilis]